MESASYKEVYSDPCQTSKMEHSAKIVNGYKLKVVGYKL